MSEKKKPLTVQSLHENSKVVTVTGSDGKSVVVRLTDIPGHQLALKRTLDQARTAKGVLFLVDASNKDSFKAAADGLYALLEAKATPRVLVFCNKQDKPGAKKILMVESELSTAM